MKFNFVFSLLNEIYLSPNRDKYTKKQTMDRKELEKNLKHGDLKEAAEMVGISHDAAKKAWQRPSSKNYEMVLSALNIIVTQRLRRTKKARYENKN